MVSVDQIHPASVKKVDFNGTVTPSTVSTVPSNRDSLPKQKKKSRSVSKHKQQDRNGRSSKKRSGRTMSTMTAQKIDRHTQQDGEEIVAPEDELYNMPQRKDQPATKENQRSGGEHRNTLSNPPRYPDGDSDDSLLEDDDEEDDDIDDEERCPPPTGGGTAPPREASHPDFAAWRRDLDALFGPLMPAKNSTQYIEWKKTRRGTSSRRHKKSDATLKTIMKKPTSGTHDGNPSSSKSHPVHHLTNTGGSVVADDQEEEEEDDINSEEATCAAAPLIVSEISPIIIKQESDSNNKCDGGGLGASTSPLVTNLGAELSSVSIRDQDAILPPAESSTPPSPPLPNSDKRSPSVSGKASSSTLMVPSSPPMEPQPPFQPRFSESRYRALSKYYKEKVKYNKQRGAGRKGGHSATGGGGKDGVVSDNDDHQHHFYDLAAIKLELADLKAWVQRQRSIDLKKRDGSGGIRKQVQFAHPLITKTNYRPRTERGDVRTLYFQEEELIVWEKDRVTTLRDRVEVSLASPDDGEEGDESLGHTIAICTVPSHEDGSSNSTATITSA